ncbi:MAG: hypothetical protein ACO1NX_03220 [Chitinophagaceae bacterium]
MKKTFVALLMLAAITTLFAACEKDDVKGDRLETPKTTVPDELVGKWSAGDFDITEFFNYNGSSQPDATQMIAYSIAKDGTAEQFIYYRFDNGKQTLTHRKGSVTFNETTHALQFCPAEGTVRNFEGSTKTEGPIAKEGLYPAYAPKYRHVTVEPYQQHIFMSAINDQNEEVGFLKGNW